MYFILLVLICRQYHAAAEPSQLPAVNQDVECAEWKRKSHDNAKTYPMSKNMVSFDEPSVITFLWCCTAQSENL